MSFGFYVIDRFFVLGKAAHGRFFHAFDVVKNSLSCIVAVLGNQFDDGTADDDPIGVAANGFGLFRRIDAKADGAGNVGHRFSRIDDILEVGLDFRTRPGNA